jgi:hypothetical protein
VMGPPSKIDIGGRVAVKIDIQGVWEGLWVHVCADLS